MEMEERNKKKISAVYALMHRISCGDLNSMREIKDESWRLVNNSDLFDCNDDHWVNEELLEYYIIHCEVAKIVPISGY